MTTPAAEHTPAQKGMYAKARKLFCAHHPRVKRLKRPRPCDGIKRSQVALRNIYTMGNKPPRGIKPEAHCKNRAYWRFTTMKRPGAKSGNFCWSHLIHSGTHCDLLEREASERWAKRNDELWKQCIEEAGL